MTYDNWNRREALLAGVPHWPGPESGPAAQLRDQLAFEMGRALEDGRRLVARLMG